MHQQYLHCCAVRELSDVSSTNAKNLEGTLFNYLEGQSNLATTTGRVRRFPFRFLIFTQAGSRSQYGNRLATFIEKNDLGVLTVAGPAINPNSRRTVKVWTWELNFAGVQRWMNKFAEDHPKPKPKEISYDPFTRTWF